MSHNNDINTNYNSIFRSSSVPPKHKSKRPPLAPQNKPKQNTRYESGYTEYDEINSGYDNPNNYNTNILNNIRNQNTELQQYYNNINKNKIEVNQIINAINT
eukprot:283540_1